jgi:rhamnosyltransferase
MRTDVSIVIPAKNEESTIRDCLDAVFGQQTDLSFDVLVMDSGSTDQTVDIVKNHGRVRLVTIPPGEFGHGKTRNRGAGMTRGDVIVFLNADAVPANREWLAKLLECFEGDPSPAGAFSRHLPRDGCFLYMDRDLRQSMPDRGRIYNRDDLGSSLLFSTVSCAIPRTVWQENPFDDNIDIAEDQQWAARVLNRNLNIAYQPDSMVVHSHNYRFRELFSIKARVGKSINRFNSRFLNVTAGFLLALGGVFWKSGADFGYILTRKISPGRKVKEMGIALGSRIASFAGRYWGWIRS